MGKRAGELNTVQVSLGGDRLGYLGGANFRGFTLSRGGLR